MGATDDRFGVVVFALIAIGAALLTFGLVFRLAIDVPFGDEWTWSPTIVAYHAGQLTFWDLWNQHSQHRVLFPQLLMLGLASFHYWSQRRECLAGVAIVTASLWLLWRVCVRTLPSRVAFALVAIGSVLLFSPAQSENWLWGFQSAWFMAGFAAFAAAALLTSETFTPLLELLLVACAVFAGFSSVIGLALAPAIFGGLVVRRRYIGLSPAIQWLFFSAVVIVVYFWGWQREPPIGAQPGSAMHVFLAGMWHGVIVAGSPIANVGGVAASSAFGALGVILAIAALVSALRNPNDLTNRRQAPWLVILLYGLMAAFMIGFGRADVDTLDATGSRFVTCSLMLWLGLSGVAAVRAGDILPSIRRAPAGVATAIVGLCAVVFFIATWRAGAQRMVDLSYHERTLRAILTNYRRASDAELALLYSNPDLVRLDATALSEAGELPAVAGSPDGDPSRPLAAGQIDAASVDPATRLVHVGGWIVDPYDLLAPVSIVASIDGRRLPARDVSTGVARSDVADAFGIAALGRSGFNITFLMPSGRKTQTVRVGAELHDGTMLRLAQGVELNGRDAIIEKAHASDV